MHKKLSSSFALLCMLLISLPLYAKNKSNKIHIFVTIPPYAFFVEKIAGPNATVDVLVPQGSSPHSYEPSPKQIAHLADADIFFRAGINLENALIPKLRSINKNLRIADLRNGIKLRNADPHIWLSPKLAGIQARTITDAMCEIDSYRCGEYKKNLDSLLHKMNTLDMRIAKSLAPFRGKSLYVFHPSFGYFTNAYGLKQVAIEVEGKQPRARQLASLIDRAKNDGIRVIFVEPQFSAKSAKVIADAIGGIVVKLDPLSRDYLKNLESITDKIEKGLR